MARTHRCRVRPDDYRCRAHASRSSPSCMALSPPGRTQERRGEAPARSSHRGRREQDGERQTPPPHRGHEHDEAVGRCCAPGRPPPIQIVSPADDVRTHSARTGGHWTPTTTRTRTTERGSPVSAPWMPPPEAPRYLSLPRRCRSVRRRSSPVTAGAWSPSEMTMVSSRSGTSRPVVGST